MLLLSFEELKILSTSSDLLFKELSGSIFMIKWSAYRNRTGIDTENNNSAMVI